MIDDCPNCGGDSVSPSVDGEGVLRLCRSCVVMWRSDLPQQLRLPLDEAGTITVP